MPTLHIRQSSFIRWLIICSVLITLLGTLSVEFGRLYLVEHGLRMAAEGAALEAEDKAHAAQVEYRELGDEAAELLRVADSVLGELDLRELPEMLTSFQTVAADMARFTLPRRWNHQDPED